MNNEIEQLAEQHGMTVEFVAWFFGEKKAACGSFWLMMMAAMWEGWKGRDGESTAALATIEKCREVSGCPAGVDLQDHLQQLAAENVALKNAITDHSQSVHFCEVCGKDDPCSTDDVCYALKDIPATDRIVAGIKADRASEFIHRLQQCVDEGDFVGDEVAVIVGAIDCGKEFCEQLREGAK
ncbi:hypothetical protein [Raoultella terrigena]|uniref:hypothetical protein n=1 Tax=Raoultella terrigena TaxID=577 RepID=UPI00389205F2